MLLERPTPRRRLISLTPLIDVVLILLVFFMLASNFIQWRVITLESAPVSTQRRGEVQGAVLVRLHADGQLDLNGERVSAAALELRLEAFLRQDARQSVLVQPAQGVDLQSLVSLLDRLYTLGVAQLGVTGGGA